MVTYSIWVAHIFKVTIQIDNMDIFKNYYWGAWYQIYLEQRLIIIKVIIMYTIYAMLSLIDQWFKKNLYYNTHKKQ